MTGNHKNFISLFIRRLKKILIEIIVPCFRDKPNFDKKNTKDSSSVSSRYRNRVYLCRISNEVTLQERVGREELKSSILVIISLTANN